MFARRRDVVGQNQFDSVVQVPASFGLSRLEVPVRAPPFLTNSRPPPLNLNEVAQVVAVAREVFALKFLAHDLNRLPPTPPHVFAAPVREVLPAPPEFDFALQRAHPPTLTVDFLGKPPSIGHRIAAFVQAVVVRARVLAEVAPFSIAPASTPPNFAELFDSGLYIDLSRFAPHKVAPNFEQFAPLVTNFAVCPRSFAGLNCSFVFAPPPVPTKNCRSIRLKF